MHRHDVGRTHTAQMLGSFHRHRIAANLCQHRHIGSPWVHTQQALQDGRGCDHKCVTTLSFSDRRLLPITELGGRRNYFESSMYWFLLPATAIFASDAAKLRQPFLRHLEKVLKFMDPARRINKLTADIAAEDGKMVEGHFCRACKSVLENYPSWTFQLPYSR